MLTAALLHLLLFPAPAHLLLRQIAARAGTHVSNVRNVIIWGNHSSTQFPDVAHGTVDGRPIREVLRGEEDAAWLDGEFVETVQQRGAAVIKVSGQHCC